MALVGRDELLRALDTDVDAGRSVLLTGPRGSGRTAVLDTMARRAAPRRTALVSGRERLDGVPFAPWARLLADHHARLDEPLSVYTELPPRIAAELDLLLVDDLDLLDPASALLTVQLARTGLCVVATGTDPATTPDALRDTVRRWSRHELAPLPKRDIEALAAETLGAPLTAPSATRMVAWSSGRPAITVALAESARAAGRAVATAGGLRIDEAVVDDEVIGYLVVDVMAARSERGLLALVAAAGALPRATLTDDELTRLTRSGLIRCAGDQVLPAAPLVAAWALRDASGDHRRQLYWNAARLIAEHAPDDARARQLAACAGRSASLAERVDAATWLAAEGRLTEAAALLSDEDGHGDRGGDHAERWRWCLTRARVQRDLGDLSSAVAALDDAVGDAQDDAQLVRLVNEWAAVLGGLLEHDDRLEERINRILPLLHDDAARATVRAILSRRRAILGARGGPGPEAADDPIVTLLREAMGGSLEFAREHFIPPSDDQIATDEDLEELLQVLGRFLGLVYNGDLVEGRAEAELRHQAALDAALPSLGLWSYNRTKIAFHAGQYRLAVVRGREMRRHLEWRDVAGQALPGIALLAAALARDGQLTEAQQLIAGLGEDERALPRVLIGVRRVEAEALLDEGDPAGAARLVHAAGRYALGAGEGHSGLLAIDEAFTIDPTPAYAAELRELADQSRIAAAAADRAEARLAGDAAALEETALRFAAMPLPGRAVQAWEWAAAIHEAAGRSEARRRCAGNAVLLASEHALAPWPDRATPRLTGRELEVATLAAERNRSREIAEQLGLSVRTVDNHLARVFRKLGVSRREELAAALARS